MSRSNWSPPLACSDEEEAVLKLCKKQKLWRFLRENRHVILDEEVRSALHELYSQSGRGRPPESPERLALAMLLQVAFNVADHEVPTLTVVDRRWQVVLDVMGASSPAFSQGTVFDFRERARRGGLMRVLLEKTVAIARETRGFGHKRLRAIFDSSPLVGAGRVEDTFNLLGHAISDLVTVAAKEAERQPEELRAELGLTIGSAPSIKAALDVDWREPTARTAALNVLIEQFERVQQWLQSQFDVEALTTPPLVEPMQVVERILEQDTEPDPDSPGPAAAESSDGPPGGSQSTPRRIRQGGKDRQVSLSDPDMRFGRKSSHRVFAGYKRHVAVDADIPQLICDVEVLAASRPEHEAVAPLLERLTASYELNELQVDRGYLPSEALHEQRLAGVALISKPPAPRATKRFSKWDFEVDFDNETATCPAGVVVPLRLGHFTGFPSAECRPCKLREQCISEKARRRQVRFHPHEQFHREMAEELGTPEGRAKRRERVVVEHSLARVGAIQGNRSRFRGRAKTQFDTERVAVVNNLFVINGIQEAQRQHEARPVAENQREAA